MTVKKVDPPAPEEWSPDKPLDDADAEGEAQARSRGAARVEYLKNEHLKKVKKEEEKKEEKKFSVF